jgi:hypothetical protein
MSGTRRMMLYGLCVVAVIVLAGCGGNIEEQSVQPPENAAKDSGIPVSGGVEAAYTPTPEVTATPVNTATPLPTAAPTARPTLELTPTPAQPPFYDRFVAAMKNGNAKQVVGVYVEGVMAFRVVQQPPSNPAFVSGANNVVTWFAMVKKSTGNNGLLAHNFLAGIKYVDLAPGQVVILVYGDGHTEEFVVDTSSEYQALNPTNPSSNFVSVANGERLTSASLFSRVYSGAYRTIFQTCIARDDQPSWGRLFIVAPEE